MKKFRVAVLANLKVNAPKSIDLSEDQWADLDSERTVGSIVEAICSNGHVAEFFEANLSLVERLPKYQPDICFNISEGHYGDAREAQIPALLEMLRIPYTGSKVLTLALSLDKPMTKRVLAYHDLPTPPFQVFDRVDDPLSDDMTFPMFVKPSREGTGMGVSSKSIVHDRKELKEQVAYVLATYHQPALCERYIEGREVTLGLVGNLIEPVARRIPEDESASHMAAGLRFFPPLEVDLKPYLESDAVYSNRLKVDLADQLNYLAPAPLDETLVKDLKWITAAVFRVTGALDVSRIDFRLDIHDNLTPYILEINPLPGLSPGISDLVIEAEADGVHHAALVNMILDAALKRCQMI